MNVSHSTTPLVAATLATGMLLSVTSPAVADCTATWENALGMPGPGSCVYGMEVFDDGSGPAIYAAGIFSALDRVAKWDGENWQPLGDGVGPDANALLVFDDGTGPALYITGSFTTAGGRPANRIARWDGLNWSTLGDGLDGQGLGLSVFDDGSGPALYVTGIFSTAGGVTVNNVARWDGADWSALGTGVDGAATNSTVYDDGNGEALYVVGVFTTAGGVSSPGVARWDGSTWSSVGGGAPGTILGVSAIDVEDGNGPSLYIGGIFNSVGDGVSANNIARWDGESWSAVGDGTNGLVRSIVAFDDGTGSGKRIYAGGNFSVAGDAAANNVARWNGSVWSRLGNGLEGTSNQAWKLLPIGLDIDDAPGLYVGGCFSFAGGLNAHNIAVWRGCAPDDGNPADLNGDGVVNVMDLLILLDGWGPCPAGESCPADINGDGTVDVFDLLLLLANWG